MEQYTACVLGEFKKFNPDGSLRNFSGNTFLCHVEKNSPFYRFALWVQADLRLFSFFDKFAFLPCESFHMTVYEGVCDQVRRPDNWIKGVPLDTPLEQITGYFMDKIGEILHPKGFAMRAERIRINEGVQFVLVPDNKQTELNLKEFRRILKEETDMMNLNENEYLFHCSLAYILRCFTPEEEELVSQWAEKITLLLKEPFSAIKFGPVEFCTFSNMGHFTPRKILA